MPIQIPEIQRNDPQNPATVGRIDVQIPDGTKQMAENTQGLVGLGDEVNKYVQQQENNAASTAAIKAANDYDVAWKENMYGNSTTGKVGAKFQTGDPTKIYKDFDDTMDAKFKELSGQNNDDMPAKTRNAVTRALAQKHNLLYDQRLVEFGNQSAQYDKTIATDGVKLSQSNMLSAVGLIKPDDPSTFAAFESHMGNIRDIRLAQGLKTGSVTPDANGSAVIVDPSTGKPYVDKDGNLQKFAVGLSTQLELKKDTSDGIYHSIDNALMSNHTDIAKSMMDRYMTQMDPVTQNKLQKQYTETSIKNDAYQAASEVSHLPTVDDQIGAINKKFSSGTAIDEEKKEEAIKFVNSGQTHIEAMQTRQSKDNYNPLMSYIQDRQNSGNPILDSVSLKDDPQFKRYFPNINDPKQRAAIYDSVNKPPKESNNDQKNALLQHVTDGSFYQMTPQNLALAKNGLNLSDKKLADSLWLKANNDTDGQERERGKFLMGQITEQAIAKEDGKPALFRVNSVTSKLSPDDQAKLDDIKTRVLADPGGPPKGAPTSVMVKYIHDVISDEIIKKAKSNRSFLDDLFGTPVPTKQDIGTVKSYRDYKGSSVAPDGTQRSSNVPTTSTEATVAPSPSATQKLSDVDLAKAMADFQKANNRPVKDASELNAFIEKQKATK